jgi:hypothetical protein
MKSKKILQIYDASFNLPDDFQGTLGDALYIIADYRKEMEKTKQIDNTLKPKEGEESIDLLWEHDELKASIQYRFGFFTDEEWNFGNAIITLNDDAIGCWREKGCPFNSNNSLSYMRCCSEDYSVTQCFFDNKDEWNIIDNMDKDISMRAKILEEVDKWPDYKKSYYNNYFAIGKHSTKLKLSTEVKD